MRVKRLLIKYGPVIAWLYAAWWPERIERMAQRDLFDEVDLDLGGEG
jgi:hypothetical protein